ncbi:hypothetical protein KW796_00690 [Candidatus Parcubacteria bacterium]|nr:hypothetical protein [Candidatus Parcubacteria bacterium]
MKTRISTFSYEARVRVFWTLSVVAIAALSLYFYAVLATIHHTVARATLENQSLVLSARVSELEFESIALKNTVNLDVAIREGFTEVKNPLYVSRSRGSLTLNTGGR